MISKTMEDALSKQANREFYSAYLYLAMSAYCESVQLKGFAKWLRVQAKEEQGHGLKIYDFILARNGKPSLGAIEAPKAKWSSVGTVFEEVYAHEQKVTAMIHALVELAQKEKDHASFEMLQWFVKEQVEEEENSNAILEQIRIVGDTPGHVFCIDHHLAKRE
jgi:ferritin